MVSWCLVDLSWVKKDMSLGFIDGVVRSEEIVDFTVNYMGEDWNSMTSFYLLNSFTSNLSNPSSLHLNPYTMVVTSCRDYLVE